MLIDILIVVAILVVAFLVTAALRPAAFRVSRSAAISAPPSAVFAWVNDLHKWQEFSPWAKLDPTAKTTFDGPLAGVGAIFAWDGNSNVGAGRMTIIDSQPDELVKFRLDFFRPFAGTNLAEFTFRPDGQQTTVTWSMTGQRNFMMKAMGLVLNCDKMCGDQFEKGLATLKSLSETSAATACAA